MCTHYRVASDSDVFYSSATWSHSLLQTPPPRWRPCLTHPTPHPLAPTRLARRFLQRLMQRLNLRAFGVPRPGAHASPALTCPAYSACDSRQTWTCRGSARSSWRCTEHAVQASAPDRSLAEKQTGAVCANGLQVLVLGGCTYVLLSVGKISAGLADTLLPAKVCDLAHNSLDLHRTTAR